MDWGATQEYISGIFGGGWPGLFENCFGCFLFFVLPCTCCSFPGVRGGILKKSRNGVLITTQTTENQIKHFWCSNLFLNPHRQFLQRMGDLELIFCHSFSAHMAVFWLNLLFPRHAHFLENWVFALKMMVLWILGILGECLEGWVCFSRCMPTHFLEKTGLIIQKGHQ